MSKAILIIFLLSTITTQKFIFDSASKNLPAPEKRAKGGEDAHYNDKDILAVADGVGGWNEAGVDPALYSRKLISNVKEYFLSNKEHYSEFPKALGIEAVNNNKETGTSTLVLLTIDPKTNELVTSNIGDSGFIVLRKDKNGDYKKLYRSEEQQHGFNFPFQVGTEGDDPNGADVKRFTIGLSDLIIVGSDGLFDNLYDEDIEKICNTVNNRYGINLERLATILAKTAEEKSLDTTYLSPFAQHARDERINYIGGKSDDITVVVAEIEFI